MKRFAHSAAKFQTHQARVAAAGRPLRWLAILLLLLTTAVDSSAAGASVQPLPAAAAELGAASVETQGPNLRVSTGAVRRVWTWTGRGLLTTDLRRLPDGEPWIATPAETAGAESDWSLPGVVGQGVVQSVDVQPSEDEGFTTPHLQVITAIHYPDAGLQVQHVVWVYPDAPGLRTQLRLRRLDADAPPLDAWEGNDATAERLPADAAGRSLRAIGYYSDTQHRNAADLQILREEAAASPGESGSVDWASVLVASRADEQLTLVKESHKCVNTPEGGANTGGFFWNKAGVAATGIGWDAADLNAAQDLSCWAHWTILSAGDDDAQALALKRFDRIRYPVQADRDLYTMANTWGSSRRMDEGLTRAAQENVLREIQSQADLGIDVQQIDAGWQGDELARWRPTEARYPDGWGPVVEAAKQRGTTLGLWVWWRIPLEELIWNQEQGGFRYFKVDFAQLPTMAAVSDLVAKVRAFILHSGHHVRINWDVTEEHPRVGYWFAREYGNLWLENRKTQLPRGVIYHPHLVLRDAWQLSRYLNLNQIQVVIQNPDRVRPRFSDAHEHTQAYCTAIALMAVPVFFQETQYLDEAARQQIRPLVALHREHRENLAKCYVFPIGELPDNQSWTGFQAHDLQSGGGYLLIFRERSNASATARLPLKFIEGSSLALRNLRTRETSSVSLDDDAAAEFELDQPGDFLFLQYGVRDSEAAHE